MCFPWRHTQMCPITLLMVLSALFSAWPGNRLSSHIPVLRHTLQSFAVKKWSQPCCLIEWAHASSQRNPKPMALHFENGLTVDKKNKKNKKCWTILIYIYFPYTMQTFLCLKSLVKRFWMKKKSSTRNTVQYGLSCTHNIWLKMTNEM